jgi:hypothetical protein
MRKKSSASGASFLARRYCSIIGVVLVWPLDAFFWRAGFSERAASADIARGLAPPPVAGSRAGGASGAAVFSSSRPSPSSGWNRDGWMPPVSLIRCRPCRPGF